MHLAEKIAHARTDLAGDIRDLARNQIHLWRLVPDLAQTADGRTGFSEKYRVAYQQKAWTLDLPAPYRNISLCVACETGVILEYVRQVHGELCFRPTDHIKVCVLAGHLKLLDAAAVVERLAHEANQPISSYMTGSSAASCSYH